MTLMDSVRTCFSKYVTFSGRASRSEYWWFALFNFGVSVLLSALEGFRSDGFAADAYSLIILLPTLAVGARRLHDLGRSAWWLLIGLVPLIGWIVLIIWYASRGDNGPNRFGEAPLSGQPAGTF